MPRPKKSWPGVRKSADNLFRAARKSIERPQVPKTDDPEVLVQRACEGLNVQWQALLRAELRYLKPGFVSRMRAAAKRERYQRILEMSQHEYADEHTKAMCTALMKRLSPDGRQG